MATWPNLFIAGAPRCGTSSLHAWLATIPGIYMSRIKEPNYFSRQVIRDDNPLLQPIRDEARYLRLFSDAGDARIVGEASPTYLEDPGAPFLINQTVPDARVIVSLRDPVERLYSLYLMLRNNRAATGGFMAEIERGLAAGANTRSVFVVPQYGLYSAQVERYRGVFGDSRFRVLIFEEMMADVPGTLQAILDFLGIDHAVGAFAEPRQREYGEARGPLVRYLFGNRTISRAAEAMIPFKLRKWIRNALLMNRVPKPPMEPEARAYLTEFYREDVARLEGRLGRPLPWRNFSASAIPENVG